MTVSYGEGQWFHSRIGSSEKERDKILFLVEVSKRPEYHNLKWSGDKNDPLLIKFGKEISVNGSTVQTKIRAYIRFGFIKEGNTCPLELTPLAKTWWELKSQGINELNKSVDDVEALLLTSSLLLYSFNTDDNVKKNDKYSKNPANGYRPIYELLKHVNTNEHISEINLKSLISGNADRDNYTYWKRDLLRSKILIEDNGGFKLSNKFKFLMEVYKSESLPQNLIDSDWEKIHDDVLSDLNPYKKAILFELENILTDTLDVESTLDVEDREFVSKVVSLTNDTEAKEIGLGDYKIPFSYSKVKTRKKQEAWSANVKKAYNYTCCVPNCDIDFQVLVQAAHIKEYTAEESEKGHRANPKNGLCLCRICHALFDEGYFTLDNDLKIVVSSKMEEINSTRIREIFAQSDKKLIYPMPKPIGFSPDIEFIQYHRNNIFKK